MSGFLALVQALQSDAAVAGFKRPGRGRSIPSHPYAFARVS